MPVFAQGGHLGFWFLQKQPLPPPPSKPILIVVDWGTTSGGTYPFGFYYNDNKTVTPGGMDAVAASIQTAATELKYKSTYSKLFGYNQLENVSLSQYSQVWDMTPTHSFPPSIQLLYKNYVQNGGKLYLLGENSRSFFNARNSFLVTYLQSLGAGNLVYDYDYPPAPGITANIGQGFRLINANSTVVYNAPGSYSSYGSGTPVTYLDGATYAVFWKGTALSNIPQSIGSVLVHLDVTHMSGIDLNLDLIKNSILILNSK